MPKPKTYASKLAMNALARGLMLVALLADLASVSAAQSFFVLEVVSAQAGHDERTGEPVVKIKLGGISDKALMDLAPTYVGKTGEVRVNSNIVFSSVIREPMITSLQIRGKDWTEEEAKRIADQLSQPGAKSEMVIPGVK